jgi:putative membrane protein
MTGRSRKPAAFSLDDPALVVADEPREPRHTPPAVAPVPGTVRPLVPPGTAGYALAGAGRRRPPWAAIFWISAGALVLLSIGLGVADLIDDLTRRTVWLGGIGAVLAAVAGAALLAIVVRESVGLIRLAEIDTVRERAAAAVVNDDRAAASAVSRDLVALTRRMPRLARPRARLESHLGDIIDGGDLVRLTERELMAPLDEEARRLITAAARRVSVVTAVSPRAAVDMVFVLVTALGLVRRLALLYGARPGTLSLLKLMRHAISHLVVTGGMAASDSLIQQVVGHGIAAKLSARLGEGVLNGLLTARLGLAALEVTRPLPFVALPRPALKALADTLFHSAEIRDEQALPEQRQ